MKKGRCEFDYQLDVDSNIIVVRWFYNKSVNLVSSFAGIELTHSINRYGQSQRKKFQVTQPHILRVYKLDMMCALYNPSLKTRRCYIYIQLHSILITAVNAWLLHPCDLKICKPSGKLIQLKCFLSDLAQSLVKTVQPIGRPSLDEFQTPQKKAAQFQGKMRCLTLSKQ